MSRRGREERGRRFGLESSKDEKIGIRVAGRSLGARMGRMKRVCAE